VQMSNTVIMNMKLPADNCVLRVEDLAKYYPAPAGPLKVLDGISFSIRPGEPLAVTGPSGAGKSTLLNIVGSLDKPDSGKVFVGGEDVTALGEKELAAFRSRKIGFVFQDHHLLVQLSALENVALPTLATGNGAEGLKIARDLFERVGLADRIHAFPSELSGGERQRVAVARALVNYPAVLLCDEPTGNLDAKTGEKISSLFFEMAAEREIIMIVVTHNLELAKRCHRVMELSDGKMKEINIAG